MWLPSVCSSERQRSESIQSSSMWDESSFGNFVIFTRSFPEIMDELNYTMMFPFERNFDPVPSTVWMQTYWAHSITVSIFYAFAIHQGVKWMEKRPALALDGPLVVWNALLALFSIFGFLRMTPEFFYSLFYGGFEYSVCNSSYAKGVTGFWTEMFALSKLFELGDTAFIVLRKRPLIFLHWYHHITVLVYTWHAYKDHTAAGRWFVWMNYLVHSFMYTYYMARAMRFRPVKWIPMGITILQITQMVIGCFVAITAYMKAAATSTTTTTTTTNGMVSSNGFIRKVAIILHKFSFYHITAQFHCRYGDNAFYYFGFCHLYGNGWCDFNFLLLFPPADRNNRHQIHRCLHHHHHHIHILRNPLLPPHHHYLHILLYVDNVEKLPHTSQLQPVIDDRGGDENPTDHQIPVERLFHGSFQRSRGKLFPGRKASGIFKIALASYWYVFRQSESPESNSADRHEAQDERLVHLGISTRQWAWLRCRRRNYICKIKRRNFERRQQPKIRSISYCNACLNLELRR
ncbi:elongation of very long chain fatty acids protein 6 [Trichinella spiralis]|uniref:elongation of very long chain fatty acids protein 6 n=1 Tax=Trichinella spiralis TaxID=6334 RepID=UPI0001EFB826|nr:elongation of very long chain fatty acids protein 6 [Trichinella spiralis]